ncbi:MAG: hypothetical protein [Bacteriophage sp.]|nr:MAG: hypothetical protein [Bacteriophage sp.]
MNSVKFERSVNLAEQIMMLNEKNKKILTTIVEEMVIAETSRKLGKSATEVKRMVKKK